MSALHDLFSSIAEIVRLEAWFDMNGMSFEIEAADIDNDLMFGRS